MLFVPINRPFFEVLFSLTLYVNSLNAWFTFPLFSPMWHFIVWFCRCVCLTSWCVCSSECVSWLCYDLSGGSSCPWKTAWARIPLVSLCCFLFTELSLNSSSSQRLVLSWVTHTFTHTLCTCRPHVLKCNCWAGLWLLLGVCLALWVFLHFFLLCWQYCWLFGWWG